MNNSTAAFGNRLSRVFAPLAVLALLAVAALVLAPARAAPPDDLAFTLSLSKDSDNIVPPGSTVEVAAALTFSGDCDTSLEARRAALRIIGGLEWEFSGRLLRSLARQGHLAPRIAELSNIAVQEDPDGDILVSGMSTDNNFAGLADIYVAGKFTAHLTSPNRSARSFGHSVDVAANVVVVGAPLGDNDAVLGGAAYVFEQNEFGIWERVASLTLGSNPAYTDPATQDPPDWFALGVAISDDGRTIVVSKTPKTGVGTEHNWEATGHVFTRPAGGWTDMDTNDPTVVALRHNAAASREEAFGDAAISADGSVIALGGYELPKTENDSDQHGAVLIFNRPATGWSGAGGADRMLEQDAVLTATMDDTNNIQIGQRLVVNRNGGVIVSSSTDMLFDPEVPNSGWPGSAFVWAKPSGGWADTNDATAKLSDSDTRDGDRFGKSVAVSDSGDRILVSASGVDRSARVFNKPSSGWADDTTGGQAITAPPAAVPVCDEPAGAFGQQVALDGESTAIVGHVEASSEVPYGHLRLHALDLANEDQYAGATPFGPCTYNTIDGLTTWTCPLDVGDARIIIPPGTPDETFTISGALTIDDVQYTDTLEVEIATVDEVAEVQFDFAPRESGNRRGEPYPSAIDLGETTRLRLRILNEHGKASAANSIATILITTTIGSLSTTIGGGCENGGGTACQIPVSTITAANADRIDLTLTHPGSGRSGTAQIRAAVVAADGESFTPEPVSVVFAGEAAALALSEPTANVLNVHTDDSGPDQDDRDLLLLSVTAVDANNQKVAPPIRSMRVILKDPDGRTMMMDDLYHSHVGGRNPVRFAWPWSLTELKAHLGASTTASRLLGSHDAVGEWDVSAGRWRLYSVNADDKPLDGAVDFTVDRGDALLFHNFIRDADGNLQILIDVDANQNNPLPTGEYTLELRAGAITATRTFRVVGDTASLTLSEPQGSRTIGGRLTFTAALTDADGETVADGTPVVWQESSATGNTVLVQLAADAQTTAGAASATYLVVSPGTGVVRAASGDATDARVMFGLGAPPEPAAPQNPAASLSSRTPGGLATWLGNETATASELLAALDGVAAILLWRDEVWLSYGRPNGAQPAEAADFTIRRGDVLLLQR